MQTLQKAPWAKEIFGRSSNCEYLAIFVDRNFF
jgi:hypothetical protein